MSRFLTIIVVAILVLLSHVTQSTSLKAKDGYEIRKIMDDPDEFNVILILPKLSGGITLTDEDKKIA